MLPDHLQTLHVSPVAFVLEKNFALIVMASGAEWLNQTDIAAVGCLSELRFIAAQRQANPCGGTRYRIRRS